jgi:hypothetical protein
MFSKPRKEEPRITQAVEPAAPKQPTALDELKRRRAEKIAEANKLDHEIEMLDHDITWVERNPGSCRVIEFIAARFKNGEK